MKRERFDPCRPYNDDIVANLNVGIVLRYAIKLENFRRVRFQRSSRITSLFAEGERRVAKATIVIIKPALGYRLSFHLRSLTRNRRTKRRLSSALERDRRSVAVAIAIPIS